MQKKVIRRKKLNQYEKFVSDEPPMPDYTCPHIDEVVELMLKANDELEKLRTMNSKLRDNAEYWKICCEEMQEKLTDFTDWKENLKKTIMEEV